jgi:UDP-glucose 4-epimerase
MEIFNVGSGRGASVFDVVKGFSDVLGRQVPYEVFPRREGDSPRSVADITHFQNMTTYSPKWMLHSSIENTCKVQGLI